MITPNIYNGHIKNYALGETKGGDPQVMILFGIDHDGGHSEMTWFGTLKEGKGRDITVKTLLLCGFQGNDVSTLAGGIESNALDVNTPYSLDIQEETYNGKTTTKIKWVNAVGGAAFQRKLDVQQAKIKVAVLNLAGDFAAARAEYGTPTRTPPKTSALPEVADDLPF